MSLDNIQLPPLVVADLFKNAVFDEELMKQIQQYN